jgi:hypothetical protein
MLVEMSCLRVRALVAVGGVDIRPLSEILAASTSGCPLRVGFLVVDKVEESPDSAAGIGIADTSEIIKPKTSATRPARERIFE